MLMAGPPHIALSIQAQLPAATQSSPQSSSSLKRTKAAQSVTASPDASLLTLAANLDTMPSNDASSAAPPSRVPLLDGRRRKSNHSVSMGSSPLSGSGRATSPVHFVRGLWHNLRTPLFVKRLWQWQQMDFELALWQMSWLVLAPRRVYRNIYYHKQTKNQWARDDPAFMVLLSAGLCVVALLYGLVYRMGFLGTLRTIFFMVIVDFVAVGLVVSTLTWFLCNRFLVTRNMVHSAEQTVEWAYALDVHCNSFFPLFLLTYVLQLCLVSVVSGDGWTALLLGNTMYLLAVSYYSYITHLGFSALPFLQNTIVFLYPIVAFSLVYLVSLLGFNWSKAILHAYFG